MQRERLGSTRIGNGSRSRTASCPSSSALVGLFARLEKPIDFEALDGHPVDLIFLLLAPEAAGADHLKALARIARLLRDPVIAAKLRATDDAQTIYELLSTQPSSATHAA
jgi:PTS system nitrogen regulatory IIA component